MLDRRIKHNKTRTTTYVVWHVTISGETYSIEVFAESTERRRLASLQESCPITNIFNAPKWPAEDFEMYNIYSKILNTGSKEISK